MNRQDTVPRISFGYRRNRIRIHMSTLHLLGDPEFIHLLINPEEQTVMITPAEGYEFLSHHVRAYRQGTKHECEICSMDLLQRIREITGDIGSTAVYEGRYISEQNAVLFHVKHCEGENA